MSYTEIKIKDDNKSAKNLSVGIVHNAYGKTSGEEVVIDNLVALLKGSGLVVNRFSRSSAEIEEWRLGTLSAFFSGIYNPFSKNAFHRFLLEMRPDIIHIHNLYPLISPSILSECAAQGIPVVMTVHNFRMICPNGLLMSHGELCHRCMGGREYWCILNNCEDSFFKSVGYALRTATARILRQYYDHVNHFLCLSTFQKDLLIREGLPAERATVLPNPMDLHDVEPRRRSDGEYVAYVGRISPEKDIGTLIESARQLGNVPFKFAGSYHRMLDVVQKNPGNCKFIGHLDTDNLERFYCNARMVVFATRCYEGFPTVLLEAMSHGLPVVCSRIGGLPEIVEDKETGLLYTSGNVAELTEKIKTLWNDMALCRRLGAAGRQKMQEKYAAQRLLNRLLGIYEKVIVESNDRRRSYTV